MLEKIHSNQRLQLGLGLAAGVVFGFLLQKGGVSSYDVILGQLLLTDFTVVKVMLTAVITGMLGIHVLKSLGWVHLHPKPGSVGTTVVGGLIFGVGFAVLGYCPGTIVGAIGQGSLDALTGGLLGILIGAWGFATFSPKLEKPILIKGNFGTLTLPELLKVKPWFVVIPLAMGLTLLLVGLEIGGL
ncbi:MAG: YeeE/YedE family protein [Anaerolineae bacterium]|nr:YeeE/YedE family protein [Anaerolineae bacterium]